MKKILCVFLCVMVLILGANAAFATDNKDSNIKNIIFMVPDGGGMRPFYLADAVKQAGGFADGLFPNATETQKSPMYIKDYFVGAEITHCANLKVTDSAAGGTALSSGYKTNYDYVGVDPEVKPHATILEACQYIGKNTGLVSTVEWCNATPAAFSAHDKTRSNYHSLSQQVLNQDIDVFIGGGIEKINSEVMAEGFEPYSVDEIASLGYDIINTKEDLNNIKSGDKVWGNLVPQRFPYDINRDKKIPNLAEMTEAAIRALNDDNENGFFLMVEGALVDTGGHDNNAVAMVGEYLAFDAACEVAIEFAKDRNDTVVVIAPDHDTGGMYPPENMDVMAENIREGIATDVQWTTVGHTASNCGVFMYIPEGTEYPEGLSGEVESVEKTFADTVIDNTDIPKYLASLIDIDFDEITSELFVDGTDRGVYNESDETFTFNEIPITVKCNTDNVQIGGQELSLDGQVSVYLNERFYVPELLLNIVEKDTGIKVLLNGKKINFDTQPMIKDDRTMVPVRAIFEELGAEVTWNEIAQTVYSEKKNTTVELQINSDKMIVNGVEKQMDVSPYISDSRTYVPLRAISEAYGCDVQWNEYAQAVIITK